MSAGAGPLRTFCVGDAAGAAARHSGRRAVRLPALVQRGRGRDLHRRPRRRHAAEKDVRDRSGSNPIPCIAVVSTLLTGAILLGVLDLAFLPSKVSTCELILSSNLVRSPSSAPRIAAAPAAPSSNHSAPSDSPAPIYPVNPKYPSMLNLTCYPSLTDLPEAPDMVVFSIRNPLIPEQMRLAVKRGARAAVIYDSGFRRTGRRRRQAAGTRSRAWRARPAWPVCGPNCMGILNPPERVTTYKQNVMDPVAIVGNVGIISQSGSVCHRPWCPTCAASASACRSPPATRR